MVSFYSNRHSTTGVVEREKNNKFTLLIDNTKNSISSKPINLIISWSLPFKDGNNYSIESHYLLKAGGKVEKISPKVTKQSNVIKTIGGEYGSRF